MIIQLGAAVVDMGRNFSYVDSHCHFDFPDFDRDRPEVWKACQAQGVKRLVMPGVEPGQWRRAARLGRSFDGLYYAVGLHPWWIGETLADAPGLAAVGGQLAAAAAEPGCVAIGECGLDRNAATPWAQQQPVFELQLRAAAETSRPLIVHCVRAHNEVIALLKKYRPTAGGVVHAFSGSAELARTYWSLGFCLGVGGTVTYERARTTRETVRLMPLEALLLETDAPDMPVAGRQGLRNSPERLPEIAACLAGLREQPLAEVARQTTANACRLFGFDHL